MTHYVAKNPSSLKVTLCNFLKIAPSIELGLQLHQSKLMWDCWVCSVNKRALKMATYVNDFEAIHVIKITKYHFKGHLLCISLLFLLT